MKAKIDNGSNIRSLIIDLIPPLAAVGAKVAAPRAAWIGLLLGGPLSGRGDGYDDDKYAGLIVTNQLRARKSGSNDEKSGISFCRWSFPVPDKPLTIPDFGGGAAAGLFSILDQVTGLDLAKLSVLVETPRCAGRSHRIVPDAAVLENVGK